MLSVCKLIILNKYSDIRHTLWELFDNLHNVQDIVIYFYILVNFCVVIHIADCYLFWNFFNFWFCLLLVLLYFLKIFIISLLFFAIYKIPFTLLLKLIITSFYFKIIVLLHFLDCLFLWYRGSIEILCVDV